ncbi:MAG: succinate-semialdehyde dehydrogenase (NADP(+)), partial [Candidatus Contendobacter sp.]
MQLRDTALFRQQCYVAGCWIDADHRAASAITNPASGEILGHVPELGAAETRRAIEA